MKVSIIAAIASGNRAIGKNNKLIYKIPEDLKRFKRLTSGHVVIMGRKTFESIGKPLPDRTNIVISRNLNYSPAGIIVTHSFEEALRLSASGRIAQGKPADEVFIIGGGQIYQEALPKADKLYLTIVEGSPKADTFFPDYSEFKRVVWKSEEQQSEGLKYRFLELER
ncbi:MAG: dihydrofolate reductase [Candidatus Daviesbacteria bacterium]|nr:dihydrofolate reductase [Candidatus Daviesbacteria bacterium]